MAHESGDRPGSELWDLEHDLPPRWDDVAVAWGSWDYEVAIQFCTPQPADPCRGCGSTEPGLLCRGRLMPDGQTPTGAMLVAFRCDRCDLDSVFDQHGVLWDLDPADYTDAGSAVQA